MGKKCLKDFIVAIELAADYKSLTRLSLQKHLEVSSQYLNIVKHSHLYVSFDPVPMMKNVTLLKISTGEFRQEIQVVFDYSEKAS